jgi:hypothetical protein
MSNEEDKKIELPKEIALKHSKTALITGINGQVNEPVCLSVC